MPTMSRLCLSTPPRNPRQTPGISPLRLCCALAAAVAASPASAIVGGTSTSAFGQVATGVQFTDNWVVTARHAVPGVGSVYANGYGSSTVAAVYTLGGGSFPQNDLALLRLSTPIDIPELALSADPWPLGELTPSVAVTIATGHNQTPRGYAWAELSAVVHQIDPDDDGPLNSVSVNYLLTYDSSYGAPYVESGDSGGALFLGQVTDATSALLGVTSAQLNGQNSQGQTVYASAFWQLAPHRDWIDSVMSADNHDTQQALWVSGVVPEPATLALWSTGLVLLAARRAAARRSRCG